MELNEEQMERILTPSEEEQTFLILRGECPHNGGWRYAGHGHYDDAYECKLCHKWKWW
jgi:hypothetical protein